MTLPFTPEQFLDVFQSFNERMWPALVLIWGVSVAIVACARAGGHVADRVVPGLLGLLWIWNGIVYHWASFSPINPAAWVFGAAFAIQGLLFLALGTWRSRLAFGAVTNAPGILGGVLLAYALVGYPALGLALGEGYPRVPLVGVPCPTTIFTFGLLLWAKPRVPLTLLVLPFAWALVGFVAAVTLGVPQDFGLLASALVAIPVIVWRNRRARVRA